MNVLFYYSAESSDGARLRQVVEKIVPAASLERFSSLAELDGRLRRPSPGPHLAVIMAADEMELSLVTSMSDLLAYLPLILIVPNQEEDILELAHLLRPRYLSFTDGDFKDVSAVLGRILNHKH
ncbi:MAG: hypothetical protein AB1641_02650 [Thermodesulfobacteriota bacterium]